MRDQLETLITYLIKLGGHKIFDEFYWFKLFSINNNFIYL